MYSTYQKFVFMLIFLVLIITSFLIIKPFVTAILAGMVLCYIFYPVYLRINKKIKNKSVSSLITSVIIILTLTLPLFFVLNTVYKETYAAYLTSKQKFGGDFSEFQCHPDDKFLCRSFNSFLDKINEPKIKYYFDSAMTAVTTKITQSISKLLLSIPAFFVYLFITLFIMFYLFRDGPEFIDRIERILPLNPRYREYVIKTLDDMAHAVIYGSILIAFIQGILGGIGFFVLGLPSPFLWGMIMMLAALIPYFGTAMVWLPTSIFLILDGYLNSDTTLVIKGVLFILYGAFVIGGIDNILKPKMIGKKGGLHPALVLLGVLGGLKLIGFIGVIVGPITLAVLVSFIKIYEEKKNGYARNKIGKKARSRN